MKSKLLALASVWLSTALVAPGAIYEVGPERPYDSIGAVPWASLDPGDTILIHWRPEPYREKWVICRQGTDKDPITVRGIAGPQGELPVIDANGAVTAPGLSFWNQERGVIKIGGANNPPDTMPRFITIENLDIRGARPPYTFTAANGSQQTYSANAAAVYVEKGENLKIRGSILHDSGNGLFIGSSDSNVSRDVLVEANYIYDNGNIGSAYEHNNYSEVAGITFQYNRFGPPKSGALGNNLKDRSAGLVVRYNWIEGGNRQLDLVDAGGSVSIRTDPSYGQTFVYGNILIEPDADGNRQITHYGGDSGQTGDYRKGTLYFYNNTVVSYRGDRTTLFRLSTNDETCDARNNIFYVTAAGNSVSLLDASGVLDFGYNWLKPGWVVSFAAEFEGTLDDLGGLVEGKSPEFTDEASQDFHLAKGSAAIDAGTALHPNVIPANDVIFQYVPHQSGEPRPVNSALDLGAFEFPLAR